MTTVAVPTAATVDELRSQITTLHKRVEAVEQKYPKLLTINDTTVALSCSRATVYRLINDGQLNTVQVGERIRISSEEIARFVEGRK